MTHTMLEPAVRLNINNAVGFTIPDLATRPILAAGSVAPDLASALAALGQDESLGRIEDALSQVQ